MKKVEAGDVVQLKSGGPKMAAGDSSDAPDHVQCFWTDETGQARFFTFPRACLKHASSGDQLAEAYALLCDLAKRPYEAEQAIWGPSPKDLASEIATKLEQGREAQQLADSCQHVLVSYRRALTPQQAQQLAQWRDTYFTDIVNTAHTNVLKLRLWGHEIKEPTLKALAERDSNVCADTADLLEALAEAPEE